MKGKPRQKEPRKPDEIQAQLKPKFEAIDRVVKPLLAAVLPALPVLSKTVEDLETLARGPGVRDRDETPPGRAVTIDHADDPGARSESGAQAPPQEAVGGRPAPDLQQQRSDAVFTLLSAAARARIAAYWLDRPYQRKLFPRIIVSGSHRDVPAGAIHVWDLPLACVQEALDAPVTAPAVNDDDGLGPQRWFATALRPLIQVSPAGALHNQLVIDLMRDLAGRVEDYTLSLEERRDAAGLYDDLLQDLRSKSKRVRPDDRNPDEDLQAVATQYHEKVKPCLDRVAGLKKLRDKVPTRPLLRQVRRQFRACGLPRTMTPTMPVLEYWHSEKLAVHQMAKDLMGRGRRPPVSWQAVARQLERVPMLALIEEAWDEWAKEYDKPAALVSSDQGAPAPPPSP